MSWFQQWDPATQQRVAAAGQQGGYIDERRGYVPPSAITEAAGRGGYQVPGQGGTMPLATNDTPWWWQNGRDIRQLAPGPETPPPGGYTDAWWNALSPQQQAWRESQRTDRGGWGQRTPPGAPPQGAPATNSPDWYRQHPEAWTAQQQGGSDYDPAAAARVGAVWQQAGQPPPRSGGFTPLSALGGAIGGLFGIGRHSAAPIAPTFGAAAPSYTGTGTGPAGAQGGGMVQLRAPTGQTRSVPAAQAAFYLARGASRM